MAKHSKYEEAERKIVEGQIRKLLSVFDEQLPWPKGTPASDIGGEWPILMMFVSSEVFDFMDKWNIPPMEED